MTVRLSLLVLVAWTSCDVVQAAQNPRNAYDVLLHSSSLIEQRAALATVLAGPATTSVGTRGLAAVALQS